LQILAPETLFIGQETLYLDRLSSTNDFLKDLAKMHSPAEGYMVLAGEQTDGKGQNGNAWWSAKGDNLLTSLLLQPTFLPSDRLHFLVYMTALGVRAVIQKFLPDQKVEVKWPNDIVIANHKIAGILIENITIKGKIHSIIGIGINVNQREFEPFHFPPTSMRNCNHGTRLDVAEIHKSMCSMIEKYYLTLRSPSGLQQIHQLYVSQLYRLEEVVLIEKNTSPHLVKGVSIDGKLILQNGETQMEITHNEKNIVWN
jgi:BirA family transcriptional regulator, biotin operon repressor / biotin---[acetyl-CoA-carboxylase] ligase